MDSGSESKFWNRRLENWNSFAFSFPIFSLNQGKQENAKAARKKSDLRIFCVLRRRRLFFLLSAQFLPNIFSLNNKRNISFSAVKKKCWKLNFWKKMGAYLSAPVTDKFSSDVDNELMNVGSSSMQGWRRSQEVSLLRYSVRARFWVCLRSKLSWCFFFWAVEETHVGAVWRD